LTQKKKILYVIDGLARGGTELQLTGLIERLDRSRFAPHLLTIRPTDTTLNPSGCPHLGWDVPRLVAPGGVAAVRRLARLLKAEKFSVVQTFFQDATILGGAAARWAGTPGRLACFRDLGFWRTKRQEWLLRRIYPMMTGFLANAETVKSHFCEHDGLDPGQVEVIYNGIDLPRLPWVEHAGPTSDIGIVGNLNRRVKRTDLFLEAAGRVAREHPEITWHVVGDGQYRAEYEQLARSLGIADRTVFAGRLEQVPDYLAKLQVGVLCSDSEGFSNALLEYMLRGCVPVATRVGGNPEAVRDGHTGLLTPAGDGEALAIALRRLVEDVPLRRRLADAARRETETRFSWESCLRAHEAVYDRIG